ncbi:uncharacterized protein LOC135394621 [Ornithodoros turicata]|uniref:uncharacterized protein LOC135394621 n=1 Tax=Ornithodoros turicata TaxID=34597 RepID=UPI003138B86D
MYKLRLEMLGYSLSHRPGSDSIKTGKRRAGRARKSRVVQSSGLPYWHKDSNKRVIAISVAALGLLLIGGAIIFAFTGLSGGDTGEAGGADDSAGGNDGGVQYDPPSGVASADSPSSTTSSTTSTTTTSTTTTTTTTTTTRAPLTDAELTKLAETRPITILFVGDHSFSSISKELFMIYAQSQLNMMNAALAENNIKLKIKVYDTYVMNEEQDRTQLVEIPDRQMPTIDADDTVHSLVKILYEYPGSNESDKVYVLTRKFLGSKKNDKTPVVSKYTSHSN